MERNAEARAQRKHRGGVTPLWKALQLPVGQREDQLLYDFHASGSGFATVNSRRLRTLPPGSPLHTQCVDTVLEEIYLRGHVTVADRARDQHGASTKHARAQARPLGQLAPVPGATNQRNGSDGARAQVRRYEILDLNLSKSGS